LIPVACHKRLIYLDQKVEPTFQFLIQLFVLQRLADPTDTLLQFLLEIFRQLTLSLIEYVSFSVL
jgi:hypothetical protein